MNYLTNLYRFKAQELQEKVIRLEQELKSIQEAVVVPGKRGLEVQRFSDELSVDRPKTVPANYANKNQAPELLARNPNVPLVAGVDVEGPPSAVRYSAANNPAPQLLSRDPNVPTPAAKGSPAPVQGGSAKKSTAQAAADSLMSPFSSRQRTPSQIVADNPATPDWLKSATAPLTLPGSAQPQQAPKAVDVVAQSKNLLDMMNKKAEAARQGQQPSAVQTPSLQASMASVANSITQAAQGSANKPAAPAQGKPGYHADTGLPMVQATSDPLVSTYQAGGYVEKPKGGDAGVINLVGDQSDWAKRRLEAEVGFSTKGQGQGGKVGEAQRTLGTYQEPQVPSQSPADAMARYRAETEEMLKKAGRSGANLPQFSYQANPTVANPINNQSANNMGLGGQLVDAFGNAFAALTNMPRDVNKSLTKGIK